MFKGVLSLKCGVSDLSSFCFLVLLLRRQLLYCSPPRNSCPSYFSCVFHMWSLCVCHRMCQGVSERMLESVREYKGGCIVARGLCVREYVREFERVNRRLYCRKRTLLRTLRYESF